MASGPLPSNQLTIGGGIAALSYKHVKHGAVTVTLLAAYVTVSSHVNVQYAVLLAQTMTT
eukprot:scaffold296245_cov25-Prasinocladus_malaysianus.AAC.1